MKLFYGISAILGLIITAGILYLNVFQCQGADAISQTNIEKTQKVVMPVNVTTPKDKVKSHSFSAKNTSMNTAIQASEDAEAVPTGEVVIKKFKLSY